VRAEKKKYLKNPLEITGFSEGDKGMDRQERDSGGGDAGGGCLFPVRVQVYISVIRVETLEIGRKTEKI